MTKRRCPSCSAEMQGSNRFCSICGRDAGVFSQLPTLSSSHSSAPALQLARPIAFSSTPVGGYTPGTILADRYRINGLLGRSGTGEVYRADDLKVGHTVVLKVLPKALDSDPVRRERFFAEVARRRRGSPAWQRRRRDGCRRDCWCAW